MALAYNAADVFVVPSKADNLPTTILNVCLVELLLPDLM